MPANGVCPSESYPRRMPWHDRPSLDRLSLQDAMYLRVEARGAPMHVAGLILLDGGPLLDGNEAIRLDALRAHIESRLSPRLRQTLLRTGLSEGPQVWIDDPAFDVAAHVRTRSVPEPGNEASLLRVVEELNEPPLPRSRPLWELWMLPGLADGRVAMLIKLHHVVADGLAALALLASWFDFVPDAAPDMA